MVRDRMLPKCFYIIDEINPERFIHKTIRLLLQVVLDFTMCALFFFLAIPALQPIVHDLFVLRGSNKADAGKELETQKEVVVSMLLRLIQHHQVALTSRLSALL